MFVDVCGVLQNCGPSLTSSALIRSAFCLMDPAGSDGARLTTAETSLNIPVDSEWILSSSSSSHEAAQEAQAAQQDMQELPAVEEHDHAVLAGDDVQVFRGQWDDKGVYFYQAYNDEIADWAVQHQQFGGPQFNPTRMTWIKPSFAWVLYRSGYARKHNQTRILRVKLSHISAAELLNHCQCRTGGGGSKGRVQWDPERDLMSGDGRAPREMLRRRAIQIGLHSLKGSLSEFYVTICHKRHRH